MANGQEQETQERKGFTLQELLRRKRLEVTQEKSERQRQGFSLQELRDQRRSQAVPDFSPEVQTADTSSTNTMTPEVPQIGEEEESNAAPLTVRPGPLGQPITLPFASDSKMANAYDSFVKGTQDAVQRGIKSASIATFDLTNFLRRQIGNPEIESARDLPTFQFAKKLEEEVEVAFPGNPELQGDFLSDQLPRMAGEMANQVLVGGAFGWSGVAVMGASYASDEYEQALESGADEDTAFNAWLMNVPVGGLEAIPVAAFFKRFNSLTGGGVAKALKGGFVGAGEELIANTAGQFARNVIAQNSYEEARKISDGLVEQAALGGGVGFALNALGLSFKTRANTDKNLSATDRATLEEAGRRAQEGAEAVDEIITGKARVGQVTIKSTGEKVSHEEFLRRERERQGIDELLNEESNAGAKPQIGESVKRAGQLRQKYFKFAEDIETKITRPTNEPEPDSPPAIESGAPLVLNGKDKNKSFESIGRWFRKWFTSRGLFTVDLFNEKVMRDGRVASHLKRVQFNLRDLNNQLIKHYAPDSKKGGFGFLTGRDIPKKVFKDVDDFLRGDTDGSKLNPEIRETASKMRDHIDTLSYDFILKGMVSGKMKGRFLDNIGHYIHRQYEVHQYGAEWAKKMKKENPEIIYRAEQFLIDSYAKHNNGAQIPQQQLKNTIDDILVGQYQGNLIFSNRQQFDKDFDLGPMMKRQDISPEIRALMGEVRDPLTNYADTVTKMAEILETRQMYDNWAKRFKGQLFYDENSTRPEGFNFKIEGGNDPVFKPIDGMRTNRDIFEAMQAMNRNVDISPGLKMFLKANSVAKYSKVVTSHTTQIRNVIGGTKYMIRQGIFPKGSEFKTGFQAVKDVFVNPKSDASRAMFEEWAELGLLGKSPIGKDISEAIRDWAGDSFDTVDLTRALLDKGLKSPLRAGKISAKKASDLYKAGDDMLRIAFYEAELRRLQKADPSITKQEVATRILDYYQNYDALPKVVQELRKVPFIAPFVAHGAEVIRTGYNTAWYAKQEIQSDNPELRKIGYQRMVGLGVSATLSTVAAMAMKNMLGINEDMDEDIRKFAAPWDANSTLLPLSYKNGEARYINLSYIDVDEVVIDPIMTLFGRGGDPTDTPMDNTINALGQLMQPLYQEEIFFKMMRELSANEKESGAPIYSPLDKPGDKAAQIFTHMWGAFEPGSVTSVARAFEKIQDEDSPGEPSDELIGLMGMRITALDINRSLGFNTRDYRDKIREARRIYNRVRFRDDSSRREELDALSRSNEAYEELFINMRETYRSARRLGVSEQEIIETFDDSGLSKQEIKNIRMGRFQPFELAEEEQ